MKCGDKGSEPVKTVGASSMAIGSMRVAMNYVLNVGMEKVKDTMKGVIHLTVHLIYIYV